MMRFGILACAGLCLWTFPLAAADPASIQLPGLQYQVLGSGSGEGAHPTRADDVRIRYVGRLADGRIFSTSAEDGAGLSTFPVKSVIPGFSALVRLMRPGDRWRFRIPAYLGYGPEGKRYAPGDPNLKRDIPPDSDLVFDVELVSIAPAR
ncbi:FKBP-type peptidyl-prolyl cis-trans isomerase [Sphingosinicella sp. BN140058]|uniref:FKBP-type peptidyl-prolyl cis-trans isomerase n=1 Tax=Sphingosinicella sp. BN140058 TaxID=1892855 RepID=UPI0010104B19|nr:FKBP-type peptidyl-prolyl cis-trans isomerase [Sphingosinicella sp. BN140058]QAY78321.1 FKBP-type peptidyl-prolyl cis-trans isomerase [Sphingosinicella sp. BN140058]